MSRLGRAGRALAVTLFAAQGVGCAVGTPPPRAGEPPRQWVSPLDRNHPLIGRLYDVGGSRFIESSELFDRLAAARFVLLGERHDNPDHHRLQSAAVQQLVQRGRRPSVVFEMLEVEQQPDIDAYRSEPAHSVEHFGVALGWSRSGWPPYEQYRPIFEVAFQNQLPIFGGNVSSSTARALARSGGVLPSEAASLELGQLLTAPLEASLRAELEVQHCGHLPESMFPGMALAQRARDASMSRALLRASETESAVLIAGAGHVRRDRGVPYQLGPAGPVVTLAFLEVQTDWKEPSRYAAPFSVPALPFDFVWFTPRTSDEDPCEAFRERPGAEPAPPATSR